MYNNINNKITRISPERYRSNIRQKLEIRITQIHINTATGDVKKINDIRLLHCVQDMTNISLSK